MPRRFPGSSNFLATVGWFFFSFTAASRLLFGTAGLERFVRRIDVAPCRLMLWPTRLIWKLLAVGTLARQAHLDRFNCSI